MIYRLVRGIYRWVALVPVNLEIALVFLVFQLHPMVHDLITSVFIRESTNERVQVVPPFNERVGKSV